jgi:predicted nucleic acid-binding protein
VISYLDTSSLVKLYVLEDGTREIRSLIDDSSMVATSVIAYAEARAALARRTREGSLSKREHVRAKADLESDWPLFLSLEVTAVIARHAGDLAERHSLRGFDALHLAAYLALLGRMRGEPFRFSSFDARLNAAAAAEAR